MLTLLCERRASGWSAGRAVESNALAYVDERGVVVFFGAAWAGEELMLISGDVHDVPFTPPARLGAMRVAASSADAFFADVRQGLWSRAHPGSERRTSSRGSTDGH